jgi:hypothetical protein
VAVFREAKGLLKRDTFMSRRSSLPYATGRERRVRLFPPTQKAKKEKSDKARERVSKIKSHLRLNQKLFSVSENITKKNSGKF